MPEAHPGPPDPVAINAVLIAVRQAADVLCDRWTMTILIHAFSGASRFSDFREKTGMASRQLTLRLRALEAQGILIRMPYQRRPLRYGSHLTIMGQGLFDTLACMVAWEQRHGSLGESPAVGISHSACPTTFATPELVCEHCGTPVTARNVSGLEDLPSGIRPLPLKKNTYRRAAGSRGASTTRLPLPECMEIIGDKWTIEILVVVFLRISSFVDMQKASGISSNVLSDRLARLLRLGVLRQTTSGEGGRTGAYRITDKGVAFYPILLAIQAWADEWLPDRLRSPLPLKHRYCGHPLRLAVACSACGERMSAQSCAVSVDP